MKKVMEQFEDRTTQRFHEYDERMQSKRMQCKDKCDKEIQKIILKDKLEKQMEQQLTTLETKINTDDIPACVCEKSLADKVEKGCLKCAQNLGGIVVPSSGVLGGIGEFGLSVWKPAALAAAKEFAEKAGAAAGKAAGDIKDKLFPDIFKNFVNTKPYTEVTNLGSSILGKYKTTCESLEKGFTASTSCTKFQLSLRIHLPGGNTYGTPASTAIPRGLKGILENATKTAKAAELAESTNVTAELTAQETILINTTYTTYYTAIIASIAAIVVIVLIMVIIYLILRYKRKKKMKKKLQYIKLLEE
ncbi:rifin [Plasmodium falciparum Dd2]|uniref:Rifin n=1 Tax=Plasmodium falciparum (isolate Dd2) TaxID=57267 RepID=A0A0L7M8S5_PLAF4|nr:rifin [Plasmodium falciparum Dd2]